MRLLMLLEYRFQRTPDGTVWTEGAFSYPFLIQRPKVFDSIRVLARVKDIPERRSNSTRVDGPGVTFAPVPNYVGVGQYLLRAQRVRAAIRRAFEPGDAVAFRGGSQVAATLALALRERRYPYGVRVVGDPYEVLAPGVVSHPLRPFLRYWVTRQLRQQCAWASAVAYVTSMVLQRRYPASPGAFSTHYSDVELPPEAFVASPRSLSPEGRPFRIVFVGALAQMYKGADVLLDALAMCAGKGLSLEATLVGDGRYRGALEEQAAKLGLLERARFIGQLASGAAVREELDRGDLFVLPSRTEGLPRALLEAMARGLPCVATAVGGIPELLPAADTVPPNDAPALARKLEEVIASPERRAAMSLANLETASGYREDMGAARRAAFYGEVRDRTERWRRDAARRV
ncbi:MAG: glycosyltransferase family 4 protein [Acidobacteriia bacterium]|nr:glycosyltransferase family 4 protein [Terriglobia bacterium]